MISAKNDKYMFSESYRNPPRRFCVQYLRTTGNEILSGLRASQIRQTRAQISGYLHSERPFGFQLALADIAERFLGEGEFQ